jgi:hypothetical protein
MSASICSICFSGLSAVTMFHSTSGCSLAHSLAHQTTPAVQPWSAAGMLTPMRTFASWATGAGATGETEAGVVAPSPRTAAAETNPMVASEAMVWKRIMMGGKGCIRKMSSRM